MKPATCPALPRWRYQWVGMLLPLLGAVAAPAVQAQTPTPVALTSAPTVTLQGRELATLMADSLAPLVWQVMFTPMLKVLEAFVQLPGVERVAAFDGGSDRVLAEAVRRPDSGAVGPTCELSEPMHFQGQVIGRVVLTLRCPGRPDGQHG